MTLSRNQLVLIILLLVVAAAVGIAIYYVEHLFKEREKQADLIREGRTEELFPAPPPAQGGPPPLDRPTKREDVVLAVLGLEPPKPESKGHNWKRNVVWVRGNGEFARLPSLPDEPGPIVTGVLDRPRLDDLLRRVAASVVPASHESCSAPAPYRILVRIGSANPDSRPSCDQTMAEEILRLVGKSMDRSAVPGRIYLRTEPAEGEATAPWPFPRHPPETFLKEARISLDNDRVKFREAIFKVLDEKARFSFKDKVWKVVSVELVRALP